MNIEVKPYMLGGSSQQMVPSQTEPDASLLETEGEMDLGLDVKYEIRPGLLLDATLNTDFAQVEVDDEQVNLTRFDLFFPEKRDFFLENAGIFEMGWRSSWEPPPFLLFFLEANWCCGRRGCAGAGRCAFDGRVGSQTLGLMNVVTNHAFAAPRTNFAVARVKRDLGSTNYVGGMITDRRSADDWNTAAGADFSFWPGRALNVQGFVATTATSGVGGEGTAWRLAADYQKDRFGVTAGHLGVTDGANPAMGFVTRTDIVRAAEFRGRALPALRHQRSEG